MLKLTRKGKVYLFCKLLYNDCFLSKMKCVFMSCLFCKIAQGEIPATVVFESDDVMAFRDLNPQAPTHILVIPKRHISTINDVDAMDALLLGKMVLAAQEITAVEAVHKAGYRLVFNVNSDGGQTVHHIHLHILGGRQMTWPPG